MPMHSDRRETRRWVKFGPPIGVATGSPSDCVTAIDRAVSPAFTTFLAEKLPMAITVRKPNLIRL